jgi:hypothetical protein
MTGDPGLRAKSTASACEQVAHTHTYAATGILEAQSAVSELRAGGDELTNTEGHMPYVTVSRPAQKCSVLTDFCMLDLTALIGRKGAVMVFVLLPVIKEVIDCVTGAKDLSEYLICDQIAEQLDVLCEVETDTACRLLKEARNREGEARRHKLELALSHLESAYTIFARRAEMPLRHGISTVRGRADAFESASQAAFLSASVHRALQIDQISVCERLLDAEGWYLRGAETARKSRELDLSLARSGRSAGRLGNPLPPKIVASNIARADAGIRALENEITLTRAIMAEALITLDFHALGERSPWQNTPHNF